MFELDGFQSHRKRPDDVVTGVANICAKGNVTACSASRILRGLITSRREIVRKR
jgi:hypothetical protein